MSAADALDRLDRFLTREQSNYATDSTLIAQARALSVAYTQGGAIAVNAAGSLAYLGYFGPRAIAAVTHAAQVLTTIPHHVVDVGAGSGASALALFALGVKRVTLVDRDARALALAKRLLQGFDASFASTELAATRATDADGLCCAFTFGEIPLEPRAAYATFEQLAPRAHSVVLVDAGDRPRARRLQELRDCLVTEGKTIAGPCAHNDPCPALKRERDWCHDRIAKALPSSLMHFAERVGRDVQEMNLSWLTMSATAPSEAIVVIGEAVRDKGRVRLPVCGPDGVRFVQAMKRHKDAHDTVRDLPRGARLSSTLAKDVREGIVHVSDVEQLTS